MDDNKPWYTSATIWGAALAVVAPVVDLLTHKTVSSADMQAAADALAGIGSAIGGLVAIYGRVKATKTIGSN